MTGAIRVDTGREVYIHEADKQSKKRTKREKVDRRFVLAKKRIYRRQAAIASKDQIQHLPRILAAILTVYQSKNRDKLLEFVCPQRFCKTIRYPLRCGNPFQLNCLIVDQLASFVIFDKDELGFAVILLVLRLLDRCLVICIEEGRGRICAWVAILKYDFEYPNFT